VSEQAVRGKREVTSIHGLRERERQRSLVKSNVQQKNSEYTSPQPSGVRSNRTMRTDCAAAFERCGSLTRQKLLIGEYSSVEKKKNRRGGKSNFYSVKKQRTYPE